MARDIPSSTVDASSIPPAMAARLAMAVVAHVLYVKEQIPLLVTFVFITIILPSHDLIALWTAPLVN
jgi:hypothetical protein